MMKNQNKYWLKQPKAVPKKTKFGSKYKWFKISYLNSFSENVILVVQVFYIHPHVPVTMMTESVKSNKN